MSSTSVTFVSDSELTIISPPDGAGAHGIDVTTPKRTIAYTSVDVVTYS